MMAIMTLDLVTLVPGRDEKETFEGLLTSRVRSLEIHEHLQFRILVHPRHDPGCFQEAPDILQPFQSLARYAMVVLDYEGSGQESLSPQAVQQDLRLRMEKSGWTGRVEILVLTPELESWIWSDSPKVDEAVGWQGRIPPLRD